jgi:hypothetical protein
VSYTTTDFEHVTDAVLLTEFQKIATAINTSTPYTPTDFETVQDLVLLSEFLKIQTALNVGGGSPHQLTYFFLGF